MACALCMLQQLLFPLSVEPVLFLSYTGPDDIPKGFYKCSFCYQANIITALTHTHTRLSALNGPLSRTTRVSRYQKGKTNLDFY